MCADTRGDFDLPVSVIVIGYHPPAEICICTVPADTDFIVVSNPPFACAQNSFFALPGSEYSDRIIITLKTVFFYLMKTAYGFIGKQGLNLVSGKLSRSFEQAETAKSRQRRRAVQILFGLIMVIVRR